MKRALVATALLVVLGGAAAAGPPRVDYATVARSILPPGEYGSVDLSNPHATDQLKMYDALTPKFDQVTAADLESTFKPEPLWTGKEKATRVERPGRGVTIERDQWDVPHVFGKTEAAVFYGAGYAAAEDRGLLMELARYAGRLGCVDAPGFDPFSVALSGRTFTPSAQTEAALAAQVKFLANGGATGRKELADLDAYVAGVNAQRRAAQLPITPWTRRDVVAMTCLLGARFGSGGGNEQLDSSLLQELEADHGAAQGLSIWNDLRELQDPETPTTLQTAFPYGPAQAGVPGPGNVVVRDVQAPQIAEHHQMSNAILVGAGRTASGHPIMVAGPQLGYFYPEFFFEVDLEGGGVSVRGGSLAGIPNVLIGRGPDYGWSFTSAESDNVDTFAETLCGGDDHHYVYRGECRAMTRFDAGVVKGGGRPDQQVSFWQTVHGPVIGYASAGGARVALSSARTTRGRELKAALDVYEITTGRIRTPEQFVRDLERFEMTFNGFYVDSKHIAYVSTGRLPIRAPGVDPGLPTIGDGRYDWRGFLAPDAHPHAIDPAAGELVNWNNKPAPGFAASDSNWAYGAVQRVSLLASGVAAARRYTPVDVVAAMNRAATQDIRGVDVVPLLQKLLQGTAPNARDQKALDLLVAWHDAGASRLDRDGDGLIDDPGAAILDRAWTPISEAVLLPVLGRAALAGLESVDPPFDLAMFAGSTRYVDKALRMVLGLPVKGPFASTGWCGGSLAACRDAIWAAIDSAVGSGPDPAALRDDATAERVHFAPGILPATMRWTNRPTFQQVLSFGGHR